MIDIKGNTWNTPYMKNKISVAVHFGLRLRLKGLLAQESGI